MKRLLVLSFVGLVLIGIVSFAVLFWNSDLKLKMGGKEKTPLPEVLADCIWSSQVKTWIDENQNGIFEQSELPLGGVTVYADDIVNRFIRVDSKITNDHGLTMLSVFLPGCPRAEFQVYADQPPGYSSTNSSRVSVQNDGTVLFGFVKTESP